MAKSVSEIIDEKGGPAAFAEAVGKSDGTIRVWKCRDKFPRGAWPEISEAFPDLTQDALRAAEARGE